MRIVRRATDMVARSNLSLVTISSRVPRARERPSAFWDSHSAMRSAGSSAGPLDGEDVGGQAGQRGVQVVAQRRPGQRRPAVTPRQGSDPGQQLVDLEVLGQREVDAGNLDGRALLGRGDLHDVEQRERIEQSGRLQRELGGDPGRLELGSAPGQALLLGAHQESRDPRHQLGRSRTGSARSRPRRRASNGGSAGASGCSGRSAVALRGRGRSARRWGRRCPAPRSGPRSPRTPKTSRATV